MKLWIMRLLLLAGFVGLQYWLRGCFRLLDAIACLLVAGIIFYSSEP